MMAMQGLVTIPSVRAMSAKEHASSPLREVTQLENKVDPRVAAAAAGDREAAQALLTDLLPRVANLVRYLIGRDVDVEDITQRVLVDILRSLRTFRGDSQLATWSDRIAIRVTLSHMKRRRVVAARQSDVAAELAVVQNKQESDNPEQVLARRQAVRALDALPEEQRTVVVLHHIVGMSVPELADHLAVPFETVRSRLRLGLHKLRERLGFKGDRQ
jgi:RNA polymerase sigma-70 factor (ECF subfamily)